MLNNEKEEVQNGASS